MFYYLMEEASEGVEATYDNLEEAVQEAKLRQGKYLVIDDNNKIYFDSQPGISYKF